MNKPASEYSYLLELVDMTRRLRHSLSAKPKWTKANLQSMVGCWVETMQRAWSAMRRGSDKLTAADYPHARVWEVTTAAAINRMLLTLGIPQPQAIFPAAYLRIMLDASKMPWFSDDLNAAAAALLDLALQLAVVEDSNKEAGVAVTPTKQNWSRPMTKKVLVSSLNTTYRQLNSRYKNRTGLKKIHRQSHQIDLDTLSKDEIKSLQLATTATN